MSKIKTKMPDGYFIQENKIYGPRGFQASGTFTINNYYSDIDSNGNKSNSVCVTFYIGTESHLITIPLSDLTECKISKHIPFEFFVSVSDRQKYKFVVNVIKTNIMNITQQKRYIMKPGFNIFKSDVIFALGNKPLTNLNYSNIIAPSPFKLKSYSNTKKYALWIMKFIKLGSKFPALFISSLFAFIKPLIQNSGLQGDIDFSVLYTGETSSGKTEIIKLLVGLFEKNENIVSLSSDKETIYKLSKFRHCNVMIDDLCATDSERVRKSNDEKVSRILQQKSSGGSITYKGENARIESTIFLTAEYTPKNHSTINRCLVVYASEINMDTLTWLQENQSMYVEFITDFIRWICCNYADLLLKITNYIATFDTSQEIDSSVYSGVNRVKRTELGLKVTLMLFSNFILKHAENTDEYTKHKTNFKNSINECISDTLDLLTKESSEYRRDYLNVVLHAILSSKIPKTYEEYVEKRKAADKNPNYDKPIFFKENDMICITGNDLISIFYNTKDFKYVISKKAISKQLSHFGLLQIWNGECSYPLRNSKNKKRFYHFNTFVLPELVDELDQNDIDCIKYNIGSSCELFYHKN